MLWKEFCTGRTGRLARFVGFLLTLVAGGLLGYNTYWLTSAADEIWNSGNAARTD